jgi:hypothetical protein
LTRRTPILVFKLTGINHLFEKKIKIQQRKGIHV